MKQTDKAFWLTVIPAVFLWSTMRPWVLRWPPAGDLAGGATAPGAVTRMALNLGVSCVLAGAAGFVAAVLASPRHLRAAANVAVGVLIAFGLQNTIEHRGLDYPTWYFLLLPAASAAAAILGGAVRSVPWRTGEEA